MSVSSWPSPCFEDIFDEETADDEVTDVSIPPVAPSGVHGSSFSDELYLPITETEMVPLDYDGHDGDWGDDERTDVYNMADFVRAQEGHCHEVDDVAREIKHAVEGIAIDCLHAREFDDD